MWHHIKIRAKLFLSSIYRANTVFTMFTVVRYCMIYARLILSSLEIGFVASADLPENSCTKYMY